VDRVVGLGLDEINPTGIFRSMVLYPSSAASRTVKDCVMEKKEFKDLKDLLVSFGLYFVIIEVGLYISTLSYLLL
jgi:hypothetical protein